MRTNKLFLPLCILLSSVVLFTYTTSKGREFSFVDENVEVLVQSEMNAVNEEDCRAFGGYWNMALVCADGGIELVECTVSGEISFLGFTLSGSYMTGNKYYIVWERYSCINSDGNCCDGSAQGIRVSGC